MKHDFDLLFLEWISFSKTAFPKATALVSLEKLKDEMNEVANELLHGTPGKMLAEEYVDCFMCLLHSMGRAGITLPQFKKAFEEKMLKNKNRQWKKNDNNTYSHIKTKEQ